MARPKKHELETRYRAVKIDGPGGKKKLKVVSTASARCNLTLAEKEHLRQQAKLAGVSEAEYVRSLIIGSAVTAPPARTEAHLIDAINKVGLRLGGEIGNNLNQLTKAMNADLSSTVDPETLFAEVRQEMAYLHSVLAKVLRDGVVHELDRLSTKTDALLALFQGETKQRSTQNKGFSISFNSQWKQLNQDIQAALEQVKRDGS